MVETEEKWLHKDLTREIIGTGIEVHSVMGSGFVEYVYQKSLEHELRLRRISFESEKVLAVYYKDFLIPRGYKPDLLIEDKVVVELKAKRNLTKDDEAQLLNYLKGSRYKVGLLLNFGGLKMEVKRRVL